MELNKKAKGDLAELKVAADLLARGYRIAIPYGEDSDFDLILCRDDGRFERVQVKYARSNGCVIEVQACSHSLTNGKVKATKYYTAATIDWLAVLGAKPRSLLLRAGRRSGTRDEPSDAPPESEPQQPGPRHSSRGALHDHLGAASAYHCGTGP